jgi:hypothetical protein
MEEQIIGIPEVAARRHEILQRPVSASMQR